MKPLYCLVLYSLLYSLLIASCSSTKSTLSAETIQTAIAETQFAHPTQQEPPVSPIVQQVQGTLPTIPQSTNTADANKTITFIPFNYTLEDIGGGWNKGRVEIAITNNNNEVVWFYHLVNPRIEIQTKEGIVYYGRLESGSGDTWNLIDELYLSYLCPIIPNTLFVSQDLFPYERRYAVAWQSATAATPKKVIFPYPPQISFDLPIDKGTKLSFPFCKNAYSIQSIDSLKDISIPTISLPTPTSNEKYEINNEKLEANFTGNCFKIVDNGRENYQIEYSIKNNDLFLGYRIFIQIDSVMFLEDGSYGYENSAVGRKQYYGQPINDYNESIDLGPGQSDIGSISGADFIISDGAKPRNYSGKVYTALIWPDGSYSIYDLTSCQSMIQPTAPSTQPPMSDDQQKMMESLISQTNHFLGDPNAKVTLIEFGDYQDPYSARFMAETENQIKTTFVDTGKVRFGYFNFAWLGDESQWAAEAAECAGDQDSFWEYHDYLFTHQNGENNGTFSKDNLKSFAEELGLDSQTFYICLDSEKYSQRVTEQTSIIRELGIFSTPTFVINGQVIAGAQTFETFEQKIYILLPH